MVTNFRAFHTDEENHRVAGYALLYAIDDVIVMNARRISDSVGYAVYAGRYSGFAGPRFSSGTSKTIGDLVFIINGQQATWGNILTLSSDAVESTVLITIGISSILR